MPRLTDILWKTVGIQIDTNCAPILAENVLYSYTSNYIHGLLKVNDKNVSEPFNFMIHYVGDIISLNGSKFVDYVDLKYSIELAIDIIRIRNAKYGKISYIRIVDHKLDCVCFRYEDVYLLYMTLTIL